MSALTLANRAAVAAAIWPDPSNMAFLLARCALSFERMGGASRASAGV
jgi:hypothetical protein